MENNEQGKLGVVPCVAILTGGCIGSAIFSLSGMTMYYAGPAAILSWIIAAVILGLYGIMVAELSIRYPKSGGVFVFPAKAINKKWGFVSARGYLISNCIAVAFSAIYVATYIPAIFNGGAQMWIFTAVIYIVGLLIMAYYTNKEKNK